jgi:hypothetical protein
MRGRYATPERARACLYFSQVYAPFATETAAGRVEFTGYGQRISTPAEQRMIAEWARLAALWPIQRLQAVRPTAQIFDQLTTAAIAPHVVT